MSKYRVTFKAPAWIYVDVEAEDADDAVDKAYDDLPSEVCAQCSGWRTNWEREISDPEWNGETPELVTP